MVEWVSKEKQHSEWAGQIMTDFKRDRKEDERGKAVAGGLPLVDPRQTKKRTSRAFDGKYIAFMDDLTPCRIELSIPDRPWFCLDLRFMSMKRARCLSGPPIHVGYCATNLEWANKLFVWYALSRVSLQILYPTWIGADITFEPAIPEKLKKTLIQAAIAIGYAENECVETSIPADETIVSASEIVVRNPLTPLSKDSFWTKTLKPSCNDAPATVKKLFRSVDDVFKVWAALIHQKGELFISPKPYLPEDEGLPLGSGLVQIRDYARDSNDAHLLRAWTAMQANLKAAKGEFSEMVSSVSRCQSLWGREKEDACFGKK